MTDMSARAAPCDRDRVEPQRNVDFYTRVLGLRLVKQTVNFDAPDTYHLYYGDQQGRPSTLLTFFPWRGVPKGEQGNGASPPNPDLRRTTPADRPRSVRRPRQRKAPAPSAGSPPAAPRSCRAEPRPPANQA